MWLCTFLVIGLLTFYFYSKFFLERIKYYLKFTAFFIISLISATFPIPLMIFYPRDSRNALIPAAGARFCGYLLGLKYKIIGLEYLVKNSGCIVVVNHQSAIDLIVLAYLWPLFEKCAVISKKEVFYLWPFGLASWLWGTIFIDRLNPERAQSVINSTGQTIKDEKIQILIFPEGTRHSENNLLPFKKGAFHLAIASQCPILPIIVSKYNFLDHSTKKFQKGNITIQILPEISTENLTKDNINDLMTKTYSVMNTGFQTLATNHDEN